MPPSPRAALSPLQPGRGYSTLSSGGASSEHLPQSGPPPRGSSLNSHARSSPERDPFVDQALLGEDSSFVNGGGGRGAGGGGGGDAAAGIMAGTIGASYGPYAGSSASSIHSGSASSRSSPPRRPAQYADFGANAPGSPAMSTSSLAGPDATYRLAQHRAAAAAAAAASSAPVFASSPSSGGGGGGGAVSGGRVIPVYTAASAALDEKLHTPFSPARNRRGQYVDDSNSILAHGLSFTGFLNLLALFCITAALVVLFAGYPILDWARRAGMKNYGAYGLGGTNSSGQVPSIEGLPSMIDRDTPVEALTKVGYDGKKYVLTFSDEFEVDGRTFWPGDDPYWEAVDLHYWPTNDYEWYDPDAITTRGGNLEITMTEEPIHGMNFRSGMLQSWNKLCFTEGIIEVNISLPGAHDVGGLWPGAWTLSNLVRAGYGATSDGTWPYSYLACDIGTLPNQTNVEGTGPQAALTSGVNDGTLSFLPGQKLSACTCPGEDHPGPDVSVGRGGGEIDIIEAQMSWDGRRLRGAASQSAQFAPYDAHYQFRNETPYTTVWTNDTYLNPYMGGVYQQATSGVTYCDPKAYELDGGGFSVYGFEYDNDLDDGYITWFSGGKKDWTLTAAAMGPNADSGVSQRPISQEPHYVILNLGISDSFQTIDYRHLQFPAVMKISSVRIYQQEGKENMGCDPKSHPTSKYIEDHLNAYSNPNLTTWHQAGYEFPKNRLKDGC
ncbi:hypothetical protein JCM6882_007884 [Rhodosporidiobolus microsporus]